MHVAASIASGAVDTDKLVTRRKTLEAAVADLPRWAHAKEGLIKAVISVAV